MIGFVLAAGHFVGGILQAIFGDDWNDNRLDASDASDDADTIFRSMIASAVSVHDFTLNSER